ncbi:hypothetical protein Bhyg_07986 [Pseudolycoriella hygida]|uniref:Uncharacterized protein n=1 Tax=Pseudolycoriella hygida TaxID=35572 RepID=A0A9Q0S4D0_9DIPT|nr:hypothetical protein Bhyg_07986 [Pseudolycoriella hygida]
MTKDRLAALVATLRSSEEKCNLPKYDHAIDFEDDFVNLIISSETCTSIRSSSTHLDFDLALAICAVNSKSQSE